jgi:nanoRNase/pAp phosphatase (c-di-AMP/oligoRNAs hydrolase)
MKSFVESFVQTAEAGAVSADRTTRGRSRAKKLIKLLTGKSRILVTAHQHPDPDALASCLALCTLLNAKLSNVTVHLMFKGRIGGGLNEAFIRHTDLSYLPWDEKALSSYDAILLLDVQPSFAYNPLPTGVIPTGVIDHHRTRGRQPKFAFTDIRKDVGATSSIIFSYFLELGVEISPALAATLLYAIESDLAGTAGTPSELDNVALSSLVLRADTHRLYQMRYVDLPQSYYQAYAEGLTSATIHDKAMLAHMEEIDSLEKPAVVADFLLRFDQVQWCLVTATHDKKLILSLRTSDPKHSAGEVMRKLIRRLGEGGGHRTKAGGNISLDSSTPHEIDRLRKRLKRRFLSAIGIPNNVRGVKLVTPAP